MRLTWLGHSCFCLESGGYCVVVDPYRMDSYPPLYTSAHAVYCSHGHYDHCHTDVVTLFADRSSPFTVEELETFHDDQEGALRGKNLLRAFFAEGLRVVHCGDLGHYPDEEQLAFLKNADVLLIPVGGYYTIDAATAKRIVDKAQPRAVIPMHYRHGKYGMEVLAEVTYFTDRFRREQVTALEENSVELTPSTPSGVVVFQFREKGEI